jgi:hypothetical protein
LTCPLRALDLIPGIESSARREFDIDGDSAFELGSGGRLEEPVPEPFDVIASGRMSTLFWSLFFPESGHRRLDNPFDNSQIAIDRLSSRR